MWHQQQQRAREHRSGAGAKIAPCCESGECRDPIAAGILQRHDRPLAATRTPVRLAARADLISRMICLLSLRRLENAAPWCSEQDSTRRAFQFVESFTR